MVKEQLVVNKLCKRFKSYQAVDEMSFVVKEGEVLGLLGPNGAGKSTTMNMLIGALKRDRGEILYKGEDIRDNLKLYKSKIGIVPQDLAIYEDLTAWQNMTFFAALYGLKGKLLAQRCEEALRAVGLFERKNDKAGHFSGGMKRRLNIACAIAHRPELIIMDEPTVGIDPQSRNHILETIKKLNQQGASIIYTTHYMEEVEEIATRIVIVDRGKVIQEGTKEELKEAVGDEKCLEICLNEECMIPEDIFYSIEGVKKVIQKENRLQITVLKNIENLDYIITVLINEGVSIQSITTQQATLETVFLELTGRTLRD